MAGEAWLSSLQWERETVGGKQEDRKADLAGGRSWRAIMSLLPIKGLEPFHVHRQQKALASVWLP